MRRQPTGAAAHSTVAVATPSVCIVGRQAQDTSPRALAVSVVRRRQLPGRLPSAYRTELLGAQPNANWGRVASHTLTLGLLPTVFRLASVCLIGDASEAERCVREAAAACRQVGSVLRMGPWEAAAELCERVFARRAHYADLIAQAGTAEVQDEATLWTLCYVGATVQGDATPEQALFAHVTMLARVQPLYSSSSPVMRRLVLPFVLSYWRWAVQRSAFRFRAPNRLRAALAVAVGAPPTQQARRILEAVAHSLGVRLTDEVEQ